MNLTLNYTTDTEAIKSQTSEGQIGLVLGYNGKPFDLHNISDKQITIKIGNTQGYIHDIPIDLSQYDDEDLYEGKCIIPLSDDNIQDLPPDVYYLEAWVNVNNQNNTLQRLIFPSREYLPFTITSNMVNGSQSIPMITFDAIQTDWQNFKAFILQNQAGIKKGIATMSATTDSFTNRVNNGINGYANFVNSASSNLTSLASSGEASVSAELTTANSNVADIDSKVNSAKTQISTAANGVYSVVDSDVNSAESAINTTKASANFDTDSTVNSAENIIDNAADGVVNGVNNTVNSAETRIDSAADGIHSAVNSQVISGYVIMSNVASNVENITSSAVSSTGSAINYINNTTNSAINNVNATVNSADNHMSNFASDINDRTSSADAHIDTDVSDADSHIGSHVSSADNHIDYHTGSADSHIDNKVSSGDSYISENVNSGEDRINNDVNTGEDSIVTTTDSAVGRINNDTSIVSSDATSVTNMAQKYSNNMNSQANSAYTNINNSGESVYNGINDSARNADNDINYSADSAYTGISVSASSAYINIDGYNSSASNAISGDTSSGIKNVNSAYGQASSALQFAIDHSGQLIESDITNAVKSSVSDDFNNQAKSVQAQVGQTSNDVSTIQNSITSLSNSTGSMAINVNNQANAHADSKASDLQDQITSNNNNHNGTESNLQNQINQNKNDISTKTLNAIETDYRLPDGYDINKVTDTGWYLYNVWQHHMVNIPPSSTNTQLLKVLHYNGCLVQEVLDDKDNSVFRRASIDGGKTWTNWRQNAYQDNINDLRNELNNNINQKINQTNTNENNNYNSISKRITNLSLDGYAVNSLGTDGDLNNLVNTGTYNYIGGNIPLKNRPPYLSGNKMTLQVIHFNTLCIIQKSFDDHDNLLWFRSSINNGKSWTDWRRVAFSDEVDNLQREINNRPTWGDENWTRNQANQAATNALNQANSNMEANRVNLQNQLDHTNSNKSLLTNIELNNINHADLNNIIGTGYYELMGDMDNSTHKPVQASPNTAFVAVLQFNGGGCIIQKYIDDSNNGVYIRSTVDKGKSWTDWVQLANQQDLQNKIDVLSNQINNIVKIASNESDAKNRSTQNPSQLFIYSD